MVRVLSFVLFLAACSHAQPNVAVTIARPVETVAAPKVEDQTDQRIAAAKEDIGAQRYGAASHALLAIVCGERAIHGQEDFARCPPSPFVNTAEAWWLLGDLALKGRLELSQTEWTAAQRVVTRWGPQKDGAQLELAEIALTRATRQSASPKYAYALATTRVKLHRCGPALEAFAKVLESSSNAHRKDALDGAASCLTDFDWNEDGRNDDVIGFDRPEVRTTLAASQQPWVADLYARVIESFIDERECEAASAGASAFARQFPQNPTALRLAASVQNCP